jgi:hypothetical protein
MSWHWRYEDAAGGVVERSGEPVERFSSQSDAESWLGEHWRDLLEDGVAQVSLLEDGKVVYGPMSLSA